MAELQLPPLGNSIRIFSATHKEEVNVTCVMDNETYPHSDYDWVQIYGLDQNNPPLETSPVPQPYRRHRGTDFQTYRGHPIYCVVSGTVTDTLSGYNGIIITAEDGFIYRYLHMDSTTVSVGQKVQAGEQVGTEGDVGAKGAVHLHLDRTAIDSRNVSDVFNLVQGETPGGNALGVRLNTMIISNISEWKNDSTKVGIWIGGLVNIRQGASIYTGPDGEQLQMIRIDGNSIPTIVWYGECGNSMGSLPGNFNKDRVQVGVYDQLGAFHPRAWVNITDINW